MPRKAVRIELNKRHVTHIVNALGAYISDYEGVSSIVDKNMDEIKKLHERFKKHLKSFDRNW